MVHVKVDNSHLEDDDWSFSEFQKARWSNDFFFSENTNMMKEIWNMALSDWIEIKIQIEIDMIWTEMRLDFLFWCIKSIELA